MIGNELIYLRALEPEDLDIVFRWENDPRNWEAGCTTAPISRQLLHEYISGYEADIFSQKQLRLMIVERATDRPAGTLDLTDFDPANRRAQVGILVSEKFRRRRFGTMALDMAAEYCRESLGIHQLWCIVAEDNAASRGLFEKSGYRSNGKLRSWLRRGSAFKDAYVYQRIFE